MAAEREIDRFKWGGEEDGEGRDRKGGWRVITRDGERQEADRERERERERELARKRELII